MFLAWDESGLRLLGHPVHCQLVHFPIALLSLALPADLIGWWRMDGFWHAAASWSLAGGLLTALPAAAAGLADLAALPKASPAQAVAQRHMIAMLAAVGVYVVSFLARLWGTTGGLAISDVLAGAGWLVLAFGSWLGGELVFRHRVGTTLSVG
ncbi:MAG: DUF2231 domain-containing protein [Elusimicrobia bacterium]|nr:DUF2231 domain-containing protein [Elusimicrobiota bacterium]